MEEEIWVEHPIGVKVSNKGQVWIPKSGKCQEHFTFGCDNGKGYKQVMYKSKTYRVHRLVADCFIPNPNNYSDVNHKDEVKSNNRVENLEWCTHQYNMNFGTRNERATKKLSRKVVQMTLDGEIVKEWASTRECGRNGFHSGAVAACCRNLPKHITHKGYKWQWGD